MAARGGLLAIVAFAMAVGAALRFYRLESWPVFIDEDIYAWATLVTQRAPWLDKLFVSSRDQPFKPPLAFLTYALLTPTAEWVVFVGRAVSAVSGVATIALVGALGNRLGGAWAGAIGALAYALSPVAVLHERMLLQDGPMAMAATAALLFAIWAADRDSPRWALAAGIAGFVAVQLKVSAVVIAAPLGLVAFLLTDSRRARMWGLGAAAASLIGGAVLSVGPLAVGTAGMASARGAAPFSRTVDASLHMLEWIGAYAPAGIWALPIVGLAVTTSRRRRLGAVVGVAAAVWIIPWLTVASFYPSRYYLPLVPIACALAGAAVAFAVQAVERFGLRGQLIVVTIAATWAAAMATDAVTLATDIRASRMPGLDDWQYRSGWPSGAAYAQARDDLSTRAAPGDTIVYAIAGTHRIGAGWHAPPHGVRAVGRFDARPAVRDDIPGRIHVMVDDADDGPPRGRAMEFLQRERGFAEVARFTRPGTDLGVSVLTSR
jgi:4-amino-4-deoxy-L-arabinose transferase-like glycosyltransferase